MNTNNKSKKKLFNIITKKKSEKPYLLSLNRPKLLTIDNKTSENNIIINNRSKNYLIIINFVNYF